MLYDWFGRPRIVSTRRSNFLISSSPTVNSKQAIFVTYHTEDLCILPSSSGSYKALTFLMLPNAPFKS
jgi:hypothetical protein